MEGWFSRSGSDDQQKPASSSSSSSLLTEWNSYASSQQENTSNSGIAFDLESAVRSANDTVTGTFNVVSKGVRDIPGNFQSATSSVPSGKALMYFALFLASGVFFIFIAFTLFLPVMVIMPQKFAISFTLGCGFIIGSLFALKGPKNQLAHMLSRERLPFTVGFICSMIGTIYVSMVRHSYILSVVFSVIQFEWLDLCDGSGSMLRFQQPDGVEIIFRTPSPLAFVNQFLLVLSLGYYSISYFPGGSAGMRFLTSALVSKLMNCFGR